MHVAPVVRRLLGACAVVVHARRLASVLVAVDAIVRGGRLALTSIGRSIAAPVKPKHCIKRVDRLLSNAKLQLEVHPERHLGNTDVLRRFLEHLARVVPWGCRPIIVSDAGFQGPFFRDICRLRWDFVGRLRGNGNAQPVTGGPLITKEQCYAMADAKPRDVGTHLVELYMSSKSVLARLVVVRKRPAPHRRQLPEGRAERAYRRRAYDPWLLATSIVDRDASAIVDIYATRMQIEETFRDAKNHRFGWSLRHVRTADRRRLQVLLMLAAVAALAVTLVGFAGEQHGTHRGYQANTVTSRVLSHFVLGCALVRRGDHRQFLKRAPLSRAMRAFRLTLSSILATEPTP